MKNQPFEDQQELIHLEKVKAIATTQIQSLEARLDSSQTDIESTKDSFSEEISHAISGSLYGSDSFEQLIEISQFNTQVEEQIANYERNEEELTQLKRLILSPYFARIDFTFQDENAPTKIYIGRNSLMEEFDILIHDWRSPIAGLFYQYGLGEASYSAPSGTITGDISLKRQYEIKGGKLEYYFDADMEILDEYLRHMLSQNASPQMHSIVETIQREQDRAIRDDQNKVLIVQGVAGSGKTSVAMHRVAYLMYKGLDSQLNSNDIIIISPSNVFEQYIAKVLPELGEKSVRSYIIEDLLKKITGRSKIQSRFQLTDQILIDENRWAPIMDESFKFKCSKAFVQILNTIDFSKNPENKDADDLKFKDILAIYKAIFSDSDFLESASTQAGVGLPHNIKEIIEFTNKNLESRKLFFDDASALSYLCLRHSRIEEYANIRQVVIDEAQDYYHVHFQVIKLLFPKAKFTILGDINQTVNKPEDMGFYDEVLNTLNREPSSLITLKKSFRCTNQITKFCSNIINTNIEAFGREGEEPVAVELKSKDNVDSIINDAIDYLNRGFKSIGIICKTAKDCKKIKQKLNKDNNPKLPKITIFDETTDGYIEGIFIIPVYLSKGLEFDIAFVWNADKENYNTEEDKHLLFIACTRAMHELKLYYQGEASPFLKLN